MDIYQKSRIKHVEAASEVCSDKYRFVSSQDIINKIEKAGLVHLGTSWQNLRTNAENRKGQQKHVMAFGKESGDGVRLLVTNGHEGRNALKFDIGYFRAVCANGLVVGKSVWSHRHCHRKRLRINNIVDEAMDNSLTILTNIERMQNQVCGPASKSALIASLSALRNHEIRTESLVAQRRADKPDDLWTQFNLIQEYALRGGYEHYILDEEGSRKTKNGEFKLRTGQPINSLEKQFKTNARLWEKAMELV